MSTSLEQITNEFYSIVGQEADDGTGKNVVYDLTFVQNLANTVQQEICRAWRFPFARKKMMFNTGVNTTNTNAIDTSDTTMVLGAVTGFGTSGAVLIQNDVINYTGISTLTLTGVSNIDIDHTSARDVEFLKAFPTDFGHNPELSVSRTSDSRMRQYHNIPEDEFDWSIRRERWSRVIDTEGNDYIRINNVITGGNSEIAVFKYYKVPATMTSEVDATIPDQFALQVIPRTMAGVAQIIRDDNPDDLGRVVLQVGNDDIQKMQRFYAMQLGIDSVRFRTKYSSRPPRSGHRNRRYFN